MADHRSKSHRAPDRTGLTWVTWAEKYAPQTTSSSSSSDYTPKIADGVMRIRHQDIGLYGLCPRHDECCLVVCNQCKQVIRFQALYGHYERRHSHHLTTSRNHHSSNHKETYRNSNTNGPYALPEKPCLPDRRDSSSGSSDRIVGNSAKETAVTSSSKRKLSLSSQWDSDSSSSESQDGDSDDAGRKRVGSHRSDLAKLRSSNVSVHRSETSTKSSAKKSVQVNGVKVAGMTSTAQPSSVGIGKSQHAPPVTVTTNKSSSKHITSSSHAASDSRLLVERPSKSHATKTESCAPKLESSLSSTLQSRTSERCDSSSKSYSESYSKRIACKPRDAKDRLGSAASSSKSSHSSCDSSNVAGAKELSKKSFESSSSHPDVGSRSRSKHHSVPETKSLSSHLSSPSLSSTSTTLPAAASRSSSIEEGRTSASSKSANAVSPPKLVSGSSASRTVSTDITASSKSSNLICRNGPVVVSQRDASKTDLLTSSETSKSTSRTSSKSLHSSAGVTTSKVDPLRDTSQRHSSRSGHQSLNHSSLQPKSVNCQPPEVWPESKSKSRLESTSESKSEPKSESKSDSKSDRSVSVKSHLLEGRSMSASSVVSRTSERTARPAVATVAAEPSDAYDFDGSLENSVLERLSKKAPKSRDRPKKSPQFCKDREFDADKHCGVLCSDTGKPCTHSLTCKIHALSLRRAVAQRTKPFDQLLTEHRALKDALLRKKLQLQKGRTTDVEAASPPAAATVPAAVVSTSCISSPTHALAQRPPPADAGTTHVTVDPSPQSTATTPALIRSPRPRPKPRFRSPVFHSSHWFSLLAPATGVDEKQIARPVKLPVFPNESAIKLQDDDGAVLPRAAEDCEVMKRIQGSSYLLHHPKPIAVNRFGAWRSGQGGSAMFSRKDFLCRAIVEDLVDSHLRPPPHKKLCVEESLPPVNISESLGPSSACDPYHFTAADGPSANVTSPPVSSSTPSFLSPSSRKPPPSSKSKSRSSSHFSSTSHELSTSFSGSSRSDRFGTDSISPLEPHDSESNSVSQRNSAANHRRLSSTSNVAATPPSVSVEKYTVDFATNNKIPISERGGNSSHSSESNPRLPNGQHPPQAIGKSGKRRPSNADGVQYIDDSGYNKQQRKADDVKTKTDNWKVKADDSIKDDDTRFKDWQGYRRMSSSYETTRPSVIAFGSQSSQKSMENSSSSSSSSCHLTSSSLSNLNGLQQNYRGGPQTLNHKPPPPHISRDRHLGSSQSSTPSSTPGLKTSTQVNRTLGIPMT